MKSISATGTGTVHAAALSVLAFAAMVKPRYRRRKAVTDTESTCATVDAEGMNRQADLALQAAQAKRDRRAAKRIKEGGSRG